MSKRLQVVLSDSQYREVAAVSRREGTTIAEWVRGVLRRACRRVPGGSADKKLAAIQAAARHSFPIADLDVLLREIESGYLSEGE